MQKKVFIELFKLIWAGSVKASSKNKYIGITYLCLIALTLYIMLIEGRWGYMIWLMIAVAIVLGIREYIKERPLKKRRQLFQDVFITMNFKASDNLYPLFLCETEISEYTTAFSFDTFIPINAWFHRKDELAMYFGEKIVDIQQSANDNRIINVFVQTKPLPAYLEWAMILSRKIMC